MEHVAPMVDVGSVTHVGRVRTRNEDSCLVRSDIGLWAVADGMGGHEAGDLASQAVVRALDSIGAPASAADLLAQCEERLFGANQDILALSKTRHGATIGTTAAVLLVRDDYYACLWAGDSRVYLVKSGTIRQVSRDHTEAEDLVAGGTLSREEVKDWPSNIITRAVGVGADPEFEVVTGPASPGDAFVVCSDGLTRHVQDAEILEQVVACHAQAACEALLALALDRGGLDNITVIVVRLQPQPRRSSEPTRSPLDGEQQS
ncbi:serine/threonine-protein phosphatase [Bradyrhizobium sp. U87765 SZCCT0131]|uniref:PP2C family protein-serine/threonine phosphatase n=1 Tax=unclassified Bradyrhizobium TaxID=2631580 RepID=UPI001BAA95C4|nr:MULTISPECIES: protein phosphatase 2C domain-containing protein [unclassified Bradyrhizobium]MBR1220431.1 serine/threonine-protein phosphatase [Bradyrhizobium sp. U87765 SZCCT0131]MBR1263114.1 serine/threonine-protein phosphatase [Bradyrhizobium sp. U87765 SZCCT0134]MBR1307003.1 serine/threonine-protein phosphatase [Bradyrhizobium sp. U87765 SZCCT0110]MBR1323109.1 serine/threonine-protein phosphatase [Bradyrhizobium sp. U87765 SZCCT0109]MBR1345957.1 serine/threonine-protein phosphatase [Brad